MLLIAWSSFLIWLVLVFARGGFWRVQPAAPLSDTTLHAVGKAEIARHGAWPALVAVVPARNEADVIGRAVGSLLKQEYAGSFRVIVVDDHSADGTADAAQSAARELGLEDRLTVLTAAPLPPGWSGKVWAQSQGIEAIEKLGLPAEFLLLTDADIHHPADAATQLVARAILEDRDLVSLMVRLRCDSLWEKALIPAFVFFFAKLYPFSWVSDVRKPTAGAAGGCMMVRRSALEEAGGIESIRAELIDDCSLAARLKHGDGRGEARPIRLDLAERSESLRPYDDWRQIWNMIARTAFTQLRYSPWLLAGTVLGMVVIYIVPPVLALWLGPRAWPACAAWALMCIAYAPMLRYYRRSLLWAPILPVVALFYVSATVGSAVRFWRGKGGQWKARVQAPGKGS
ncbi:glycosyl transferase family protein [Caballeronia arationis]|jgi:hopene-associated glycosyltransferase HpnB|uniref:Hopene-associated glycosyltransferase HpnB n=1 Tax=Caballeronia arationis TaxID=1777142 RepID=A0A7Z7I4T2_9BURK|nr:glycosyltransferase [Caballeronia arationis]SAK75226.1 glycosyl transferase family protein [Caballeronia arationis]SOE62827.1 hopene-associated glycosyltransferase HpnB [Caballeronia arationis]